MRAILTIRRPDSKELLLLGFVLFAAVLELIKYVFYFGKAVPLSFYWILVDWSIWLVLFKSMTLVDGKLKRRKVQTLTRGVLFALVIPLIQILIASIVFSILNGESFQTASDIGKTISKRYMQYALISGLGYSLFFSIKSDSRQKKLKSNLICFQDGSQKYFLKPHEIISVSSAKNYVVLNTDSKQLLIRSTLTQINEQLKDSGFIRVSRSTLVNKQYLKELMKLNEKAYQITLSSGKCYRVGPTYLSSVLARI